MKQLDWSMMLFALAIAVALGAFHALEPGHGKTLVAAYLIGSRGTMRHALLLGVIVTIAHTAGVYMLGAVTLYASRYLVPEQLYPWLILSSGVMIMTLGVVLFGRRLRAKAGAAHHHHGHSHHGHTHHHEHEHGRALRGRVSRRELVTLGITAVSCPVPLLWSSS